MSVPPTVAKQTILILAGPTGGGKSALAMALARTFNGVVINADSMQVYRELHIVTARPSPADEAAVPHRLYGVLSAGERCSAGRWREMAEHEIDTAHSHGRLPIVVGGTGLYLRALMAGIAPVPPIPAAVRAEAEALFAQIGGAAFRRVLSELDPRSAEKLLASDRQRLVRAYEVLRATGHPLHYWHSQQVAAGAASHILAIVLLPPRPRLYAAINARFEAMVVAGALGEVEALLALGLDPGLPAMKAVGVRELAAHLKGELPLAEAVALAQQSSRRFAKRQMTWLRHQLEADLILNEQFSERLWPIVFAFIRDRLLTPTE